MRTLAVQREAVSRLGDTLRAALGAQRAAGRRVEMLLALRTSFAALVREAHIAMRAKVQQDVYSREDKSCWARLTVLSTAATNQARLQRAVVCRELERDRQSLMALGQSQQAIKGSAEHLQLSARCQAAVQQRQEQLDELDILELSVSKWFSESTSGALLKDGASYAGEDEMRAQMQEAHSWVSGFLFAPDIDCSLHPPPEGSRQVKVQCLDARSPVEATPPVDVSAIARHDEVSAEGSAVPWSTLCNSCDFHPIYPETPTRPPSESPTQPPTPRSMSTSPAGSRCCAVRMGSDPKGSYLFARSAPAFGDRRASGGERPRWLDAAITAPCKSSTSSSPSAAVLPAAAIKPGPVEVEVAVIPSSECQPAPASFRVAPPLATWQALHPRTPATIRSASLPVQPCAPTPKTPGPFTPGPRTPPRPFASVSPVRPIASFSPQQMQAQTVSAHAPGAFAPPTSISTPRPRQCLFASTSSSPGLQQFHAAARIGRSSSAGAILRSF